MGIDNVGFQSPVGLSGARAMFLFDRFPKLHHGDIINHLVFTIEYLVYLAITFPDECVGEQSNRFSTFQEHTAERYL